MASLLTNMNTHFRTGMRPRAPLSKPKVVPNQSSSTPRTSTQSTRGNTDSWPSLWRVTPPPQSSGSRVSKICQLSRGQRHITTYNTVWAFIRVKGNFVSDTSFGPMGKKTQLHWGATSRRRMMRVTTKWSSGMSMGRSSLPSSFTSQWREAWTLERCWWKEKWSRRKLLLRPLSG